MVKHPTSNQQSELALKHIKYLASFIGPRGTCSQGERDASAYIAVTFKEMNLRDVEIMECLASPSSYARYAIILAIALLTLLFSLFVQTTLVSILTGGILIACAAAYYLESDFQANWSQRIIRSQPSTNVIACCPAVDSPEQSVVITAHIDTHRTPFFNANQRSQRLYNLGFRIACYGLMIGAITVWLSEILQLQTFGVSVLIVALLFVISVVLATADLTPFSPGAYDNASGVGCMLSVAKSLSEQSLARTSVWLVATGGEETGSGGMKALLEARGNQWQDALWINLDQTGIGSLYLRTREGMLRHYSIAPEMLQLARAVSDITSISLRERPSQAFSDATLALKQGLKVISIGAGPEDPKHQTPRHQRRDKPELIQTETLHSTISYVMQLISTWDQKEAHA
jgi:hypothetical protein